METISQARHWYAAQSMSDPAEVNEYWRRYWHGVEAAPLELPVWVDGGTPPLQRRRIDPPPPIWEVLLDGQVELLA
jgi:hypothetical protein